MQQVIRDKGKDNIQVRVINDEIEETNAQLRELKTHLDNNNTKMLSLVKRRDNFAAEWR
jgi:hypothetical protein